jgi:hypothetical protein
MHRSWYISYRTNEHATTLSTVISLAMQYFLALMDMRAQSRVSPLVRTKSATSSSLPIVKFNLRSLTVLKHVINWGVVVMEWGVLLIIPARNTVDGVQCSKTCGHKSNGITDIFLYFPTSSHSQNRYSNTGEPIIFITAIRLMLCITQLLATPKVGTSHN